MFGVEPELLCEACADGVRSRMNVRSRPVTFDHKPRATALCLAVAAVLYVCAHVLWRPDPGGLRPDWLEALYPSWDIWLGAVWKLLTAMFLHVGLLHVLMNGSALYYWGRAIEQTWGTAPFLALLLGTGLAGGAMEWIASGSGVGLSGGLLGLAGFLIARRKDHPTARAVMTDSTVRLVLIWVVGCIAATELGILAIANWAHGAGLATGYLIGLASKHARRKVLVPLAGLLCLALVVASVFIAWGETSISRDGRKTWKTISRAELRAEWIRTHR
jgi:rhomboid protease GluP